MKPRLPMQGVGFIPGLGAKISHVSGLKNKNINNRSNIVTNSIKTFKWSKKKRVPCVRRPTNTTKHSVPYNLSDHLHFDRKKRGRRSCQQTVWCRQRGRGPMPWGWQVVLPTQKWGIRMSWPVLASAAHILRMTWPQPSPLPR